MKYIDQVTISHKRVLVRVDYNVSFTPSHQIANDIRITSTLPTIKHLLQRDNQVILMTHLGRPHPKDRTPSLLPLVDALKHYLPQIPITFIPDFTSLLRENIRIPQGNDVILLENIRFLEGEENNSKVFSKELASLGDVYVNEAFSVSHRKAASVVGITDFLPSYGGLQFKKEVEAISHIIKTPEKPFVCVLGGSKISTKIHLLEKLITLSDIILVGGALANTFLAALGEKVGKSLIEKDKLNQAKALLGFAEKRQTSIILPIDALIGSKDGKHVVTKLISEISSSDTIYDIGPQSTAIFQQALVRAKTVLWNGPVGLFEVNAYKKGTDSIYEAITTTPHVKSIVGGGDTLAALTHKRHLDHISHISTGGGALLEFIEKGTLPGIVALEKSL
ncbi:MAG: phosphoglycerate kinase [Candidatus Levybacteria bacterium]|nr:phosphoglycerate kinase [Candidatus Levybacteria bacterium]